MCVYYVRSFLPHESFFRDFEFLGFRWEVWNTVDAQELEANVCLEMLVMQLIHACMHTDTNTHILQITLHYTGITYCRLRPLLTLTWNGLVGPVAVTYMFVLTHIHVLVTHLCFMNESPVETH